MRSFSKPFQNAFAIAVAAGIVFPVLLGDRPTGGTRTGEDGWRTLIYDFQTLITGLLAVGAALVTTGYLRRQIDVSKMHAHDALAVELRRSMALAKKGVAASEGLKNWATSLAIDMDMYALPGGWHLFKSVAIELKRSLEDEVFQLVEREIEFPSGINSTFLRGYCARFFQKFESELASEQVVDVDRHAAIQLEWRILTGQSVKYGDEISRICRNFSADTEIRLNKYQ